MPLADTAPTPATSLEIMGSEDEPRQLTPSQYLQRNDPSIAAASLFDNAALPPLEALYATDSLMEADPLMEAWSPALDDLPPPNSSDYTSHDSMPNDPALSELDELDFFHMETEQDSASRPAATDDELSPSASRSAVARAGRGKKQRKRKRLTETSKRLMRNEFLADINCRHVELKRQLKVTKAAVQDMMTALHAVFKAKGRL